MADRYNQEQPVDQNEAPSFKVLLLDHLPSLRAFARSLCGNAARADDLTQDTLLKAWVARDSFRPGTNMRAWLFRILRNTFYSELRRRRREIEDPDGVRAAGLSVSPNQQDGLEFRDLHRGLASLPAEQREALIIVGASGCSYEEAAAICGCAIGTIKSRVSRARRTLLAYYAHETPTSEPDPANNSSEVRTARSSNAIAKSPIGPAEA